MSILRVLSFLLSFLVLVALLGGSVVPPGDQTERVRAFTREIEFDYIEWTLNALGVKLGQSSLGINRYLAEEDQRAAVLEYLELVRQIQRAEAELTDLYSDPTISDPAGASASLRRELNQNYARRSLLAPLVESILESQISEVVAEMGLSLAGQPVPPVLYHSSSLPLALIVSPRDEIRQQNNISLVPDLSVDQQVALEEQVDRALNVSSLVVSIGGIGVYPTMVMQTNDLNWLAEVVAHEWIHNYLSLRPLGINYLTSPELRTMNETVATIAGKEIGRAVVARYYPEFLPPEAPQPPEQAGEAPIPTQPPVFDFRREMHETRLMVDQLLAHGYIEDAERFMEERRQFFWENGYHIRKLNQAYFAFYGAYADEPGGPAGEDPVGEAVRALRAQSASLAAFIKRIAWMSSFEQLQRAVATHAPSGG